MTLPFPPLKKGGNLKFIAEFDKIFIRKRRRLGCPWHKAKLEQPMACRVPNTLVTTGLYGRMQHSIYTGRIFVAIGWSLSRKAVYSLFLIHIIVQIFLLL